MGLTSNTYDQEKLAALKGLGNNIHVGEVVAVSWNAPDGVKYYGSTKLDELPNFQQILNHIPGVDPRLPGRSFENVVLAADVADEKVNLNFADLDGEITRLFGVHGEGVRVEFYYYIPQIDWFVPHWWGHLRPPTEADIEAFRASAASGFRSAQMSIPRRLHPRNCQNIFGGSLTTQAEIDAGDCPYNKHLGGAIGNLNPGTGLPYTFCGLSEVDCIARLNDKLSHTGFNTTVNAVVVGQTQGPALLATSRGNESNLKQPVRLIYGPRIVRQLPLLAFRPETNTNHPEEGFLAALFEVCEGRIRSMSECKVNGALIGAQHLNTRLGDKRQSATSYASDISNFNRTAVFFGRAGPLNPAGASPGNISGECRVDGIDDIRVYSTPTAFTEQYTTLTSWCLMDMYRKRRYGHGLDAVRFVIQDWLDLAASDVASVSITDPFGKVWTSPRNQFAADLQGRSAQQQIRDVCLFSGYTMPFQHNGKLRILRYQKESLENVPVFTDDGETRNILRSGNKPAISCSWISDADLTNQIIFNFEDAANGNIQRPLTFGDEKQQLRAGRAFGDTTIRVLDKQYAGLGVTNEAQAVRVGFNLLFLGEFDEGGLKNNFRVKFTCTFSSGFELYQSQVIKIDSALVRRASPKPDRPQGFTYFRVLKKNRNPDLSYEVTAQAYPEDYYETLETIIPPLTSGYEAEAPGNTLTGTAVVTVDATCSGGKRVSGIGSGAGTLRFNNITTEVAGPNVVYVYYKSNVALTGYVSINGGAAFPVTFPKSNNNIGIAQFLKTFPLSAVNTITFSNPGAAVPDLDKIDLDPIFIVPDDPPGPCRVTAEGVTLTADEVQFQLRPPICQQI